jgi:hypothetical protein
MKEVLHLNTQQAKAERDQLFNGDEFFIIAPGAVVQEILPRIVERGRAANRKNDRDAVLLYFYLLGFVEYRGGKERHMLAWPSVDRIAKDTGITKNRIKQLTQILEAEGLLETRVHFNGTRRQKIYMPMYRTKTSLEHKQEDDDE